MVNDRLVGSLINILDSSAPYALLSLGMALVIATKGIDLSVGAVMAICAAVAVVLVKSYEGGATEFYVQPGVVILITIVIGAVCGLWNGILVAFLELQPIIATLILMVAGRGIAQMITGGQSPTFTNDTLAFVGRGVVFGVPFPILIAIAVLIVVILLVRRTALGLLIESVGVNARASYYAGIQARMIKLFVYMLSGMCAAVAGMIVAGEVKSADPHTAGLFTELDAILAVVIGGTSLNGGRFNLFLSVLGVLIIQSMLAGLYVSSLHPTTNLVVKAVVVLAVLLLQSPEFRQFLTQPFRRTA
ncbi:MAG: ABC transporter permease [Anaerolineae bacterium]|nr:ABC transporter permease [Chloroflexota bacterium]MBP6297993.1 ABC transporter permease [Anaerolineae bacterium]